MSLANERVLKGPIEGFELEVLSKLTSLISESQGPLRKRPEAGLSRRRNVSSSIRESQCLDTDLNLIRDLRGSRSRTSFRRSSLLAIISAEYDGAVV